MDLDLFGDPVQPAPAKVVDNAARTKSGSFIINPMLRLHGHGPAGARCKGCQHLTAKSRGERTWYKCDLRMGTLHKTSPKSDHRMNWPACGKFEPAGPES